MIYFYCQSYQAFNLALALNTDTDVSVITASKNIISACEFLKVKYIEHKYFGITEMIRNKGEVDNEVNRLVSVIKNDELHYSHTQFAVFCFYLVKILKDNNGNTLFHDFEFLYSKPRIISIIKKNYVLTKLKQILLTYKYNLPIEVRMSTKNSFMISLNMDYIHKHCKYIFYDKDFYYDTTLKMFKNFKLDYPEIDNLFIAQTFFNKSFFKKDKIDSVLSIINSKIFSVKNHPKLGAHAGLENCIVIPEFLPVEFFFKKVNRNVISIHSASLITASKFDHIKTISIIDIIKTDDHFMEEVKQELVEKSDNKILFPKTMFELKSLLNV